MESTPGYPRNDRIDLEHAAAKALRGAWSPWPFEAIDAQGAWLVPTAGRDVAVAVIDTGVDARHPDLKGVLLLAASLDWGDFGDGAELLLEEQRQVIAPRTIAVDQIPLTNAGNRWRLIAGPASGHVRFVKHPESPIRLVPDDKASCPPGCVSIVAEGGRADLPLAHREVFALSSEGEIGWTSLA